MVLFNFLPYWRQLILILLILGNRSGYAQLNNNVSDIIFTEIMADPDPVFGLPEAEFVELYNRSGGPVDLTGWLFYDGSFRSLPGIVIQHGEYFIVCEYADTLLMSPFGLVAGVSSVSLTNSGEKLALYDPDGLAVDSVIFSNNWYGSSYKADGGWSLERVDTSFLCIDQRNWRPSLAGSGGTPGSVNSVNGTFADHLAPVLIRAFCEDSISVTLVLNEQPDPAMTLSGLNFQISSGLMATGFQYDAEFPEQIKVLLDTPIIKNRTYSIKVSGVTDCSGNKIMANSQVIFGIADTSEMSGLIINELLFNPYNNGNDFLELYNNGENIVDLSYFRLASLNNETHEIDQIEKISEYPLLLFPDSFIVITEFIKGVTPFYVTSYPYSFFEVDDLSSMNNDEGTVALVFNSVPFEIVHYNEDDHFDLLQDVEGVSMERIHPDNNSFDKDSWHSAATAAGFATPGLQNSMYTEKSKTNNKVVVHPEVFSPDKDGVDDIIVFSINTGTHGYISNLSIYNTAGQIVFQNSMNKILASHDFFVWDGIGSTGELCEPGIYIALVELFNLEGRVSYFKIPFVLAVKL